jgi:hypothetical protein
VSRARAVWRVCLAGGNDIETSRASCLLACLRPAPPRPLHQRSAVALRVLLGRIISAFLFVLVLLYTSLVRSRSVCTSQFTAF